MEFSAIDLSEIPPPDVIESVEYETILAELIQDLQTRDPSFDALLESDPAYKLLEVFAYRETLLRERLNNATRAVMLPYAAGTDLDNLGSLFRTNRHIIQEADKTAVPPVPAVYESDDEYRKRIYLAPEGLSNAGTTGSYIYHALKADAEILDATAKSPEPGNVLVTLLSRTGNGVISDSLMASVQDYFSNASIRQLTDNLNFQSASIVDFVLQANIHILPGPGFETVQKMVNEEVKNYMDAKHRIGETLPVSGIYRALQQEGVHRVELVTPDSDLVVTDVECTYCTAVDLTYISQ